MKKILSIVLLVLVVVVPADAQVVQPVYIRQSNPTANVFNDKFVGSGSSTSTKVWAMETYAGIQLTFTNVSSCNVAYRTWFVAGAGPFIRIKTQLASGAQYFWTESSPTSTGPWSTTTDIIDNGIYAIDSVGVGCTFDLDMAFTSITPKQQVAGPNADSTILPGIPFPVPIGGYYESSGVGYLPIAIRATTTGRLLVDTGTPVLSSEDPIVPNSVTVSETIYSFDGTKRVTLQNNGTGYAWCRVTTDINLVISSSNYTISLAAASVANDGSGASITLPYTPANGTYLRCIAGTGTAIISGFAHP